MEGVGSRKHCCNICGKRFPCGRSLGGHMRSHLATEAEMKKKQQGSGENFFAGTTATLIGYGLRLSHNKTWRSSADLINGGGSPQMTDEKLCKKCGKGFPSRNSLYGHMRCHRSTERSRREEEDEEDASSGLRMKIVDPSWAAEKEQDEEGAAQILMLLSRDSRLWPVGFAGELSDKNSSVVEVEEDEEEEQDERSIADRFMGSKGKIGSDEGFDGNRLRVSIEGSDDNLELSHEAAETTIKRRRYECTACKKAFHSYQALGGHRAVRRRNNACSVVMISDGRSLDADASTTGRRINARKVFVELPKRKVIRKEHQCSICGKVFTSGQALGGHKRKHLAAGGGANMVDLNLPAIAADQESGRNSDAGDMMMKLWWAAGSEPERVREIRELGVV